MFEILLLDDEELLCRSLQIKLQHALSNIEHHVVQFQDGYKAIKYTENHRIDLAFIDMKMPHISGLEVIEHIQTISPETIQIVLSAYDDFGYVREAFVRGAIEYLLKPVSISRLKDVIEKCCRQVVQTQDRLDIAELIANHSNYSQLDFTNQLVEDPQYTVIFPGNYYFVIDVYVQHGERIQKIRTWVVDIMKKHFKHGDTVWICVMGKNNHIYLVFNIANAKEASKFIVNSRMYMMMLVKQNLIIAASKLNSEFGSLYTCLRQTESAHITRLINPGKSLYVYDEEFLHINSLDQIYLSDFINIFEYKKLKIIDYLKERINLSFHEKFVKGRSVDELLQGYDSIAFLINTLCEQILRSSGFNRKYILEYNNLSEIREYYLTQLSKLEESLESQYSINIASEAISYIENNFASNLKLSDLADKFHMNYTYISEIIKKETGLTFTSYITRLRMEKARHCLEDNLMSIQQIAQISGYENTHYFSRVFKKHYGVLPSEYRNHAIHDHIHNN